MRHYRGRSTEERRKKKKKNAKSRFFTSRGAYVNLRCYTLIRLEISSRTRWWCLKCVIVYLARDIPVFVMHYNYGFIESTDSMIYIFKNEQKVGMLLQKRTDTSGVGISSMRKSIYLLKTTPIDSTFSH